MSGWKLGEKRGLPPPPINLTIRLCRFGLPSPNLSHGERLSCSPLRGIGKEEAQRENLF